MSFVVAAPEVVVAAASDLAGIGSAIGAANAAAAVPTMGVLAAGADEVSAAVADLFGAHAQAYQALSAQAALFHEQFVHAMTAGAGAYAGAEAADAAALFHEQFVHAMTAGAGAYAGAEAADAAALDGTGPTGATIAAVADQARGTTGAAGHPGGRLGEAVAAVAVQNPTITAVGAGRCSIRAIADQGTPEQRLGGRIDHGQQILFQRLRRSVGRLGARIGATGGVQRLHEAVMKCRGLSVQRLIVRGVITEQPCDSLRYLVGSGRQHRGRGRRCRRVCRTQRCADIRDILRRRRQHLWSCRDKRHQPPSQPVM